MPLSVCQVYSRVVSVFYLLFLNCFSNFLISLPSLQGPFDIPRMCCAVSIIIFFIFCQCSLLVTPLFFHYLISNQVTGYAVQHIWCVSQAGIKWESCDRKDEGGGSLISPDGVAPSRTVGVPASVIFPCTIKPRRRWQAGWRLHMPTLPEVGNRSQNAAQPCANTEDCILVDLRADILRRGWRFRVGMWNVD